MFERALPHLLAYLERRPAPDDLALPILGAILTVLAYGDSRTRAVREAILGVLDPLLDGSPTADVYDEVVESIETVWADVRAPKTLSWLADVVALLIAYPCPSPERRAIARSDGPERRSRAFATSMQTTSRFSESSRQTRSSTTRSRRKSRNWRRKRAPGETVEKPDSHGRSIRDR